MSVTDRSALTALNYAVPQLGWKYRITPAEIEGASKRSASVVVFQPGGERGEEAAEAAEVEEAEDEVKTAQFELAGNNFLAGAFSKAEIKLRTPVGTTTIATAQVRHVDQREAEAGGGPSFEMEMHDGTKLCGTLDEAMLENSVNTIEPWCLATGRYRDRLYAVPHSIDMPVLCCNKDLLSKYGFSEPSTWEELRYQVQHILHRAGDPDLDGLLIPREAGFYFLFLESLF